MIAQQLFCDLRSDQNVPRNAPEPTASVTQIDVAVAWMVAFAAVGSLALLFWQI
jgi:hypothetical protein